MDKKSERAARGAMAKHGKKMTARTHAELVAMGISVKDAVVIPDDVARTDPDMMLVCLPLDLDNPLVSPGNRHAPCSECGRRVQFRPYQPDDIKKVCPACALALEVKS